MIPLLTVTRLSDTGQPAGVSRTLPIRLDGTAQIDHLEPGRYTLTVGSGSIPEDPHMSAHSNVRKGSRGPASE